MVSDADHTARGPTRRLIDRVAETGTSGPVAVGLTVLAIVSGLTTYSVLTRAAPLAPEPRTVFVLLTLNVFLACLLGMIVFWRVFRLIKERRRGSAGSKLHIRLVGLFSLVAITPAIIVAVFSGLVLDFGIDAWFSKNVNQAITNSRQVASAYVAEHRRNIAIEVAYMATDLNKAAPRLDPASEQSRRDFNAYVRKQAQLRRLSAAFVLDRDGRVFAAWVQPRRVTVQDEPHAPGEPLLDDIERDPILVQGDIDLPTAGQLRDADDGQIRILDDENDNEIRALFRLAGYQHAYLYVVRPVQPRVLEYYAEALEAANAYTSLEKSRAGIKLTLLSLFFLVAVLILLAAVWIGLWLADRLVAPIARLIAAAERVSRGDLDARVAVGRDGDELSALGSTFNRMTSELSSQRNELVEANRQVDERRRFTEAVLGSLSAGVIGLDQEGRVSLVNKTAARILELDPAKDLGIVLASRVPELTGVLTEALARDEGDRLRGTASRQVDMVHDGRTMNLNIRVTRERSGEDLHGFVVTIDDITELVAAQRTSAWADVARRIAHEIKNPLTPIQLSAERLKRKYAREIKTDPDVFEQCTDTIIRQVTDIGRMADEFSSFARMPAPVIARTNVTELVRQAVFMQKVASPDYDVTLETPSEKIVADCDGRLIAQSLTNILKNAGEAVATRLEAPDVPEGERGRILVRLDASGYHVMIEVIDNGVGLPKAERHRLTEPYMTTRRKGTGLGLAIVHKVMEDHEGQLILDDAPSGQGALVRLVLPQRNKAIEDKNVTGDTGESVADTHALAGE